MTRDAALAWVRAHETDSDEQAAQALLALIADETAALRAHYRGRLGVYTEQDADRDREAALAMDLGEETGDRK